MEEAEEFLHSDLAADRLHVANVREITRREAIDAFDFSNEDARPLFGILQGIKG